MVKRYLLWTALRARCAQLADKSNRSGLLRATELGLTASLTLDVVSDPEDQSTKDDGEHG